MNIRLIVRQFVQYVFVGGLAFVVDFSALYLLADKAGLHYLVAASIAFLLGLTTNYLLCVWWIFHHRSIRDKRLEFLIFGVIGLLGLALTNVLMFVLTDLLQFHYLLSKAGATAVILFLNFSLRRWILFSRPGPVTASGRGVTRKSTEEAAGVA